MYNAIKNFHTQFDYVPVVKAVEMLLGDKSNRPLKVFHRGGIDSFFEWEYNYTVVSAVLEIHHRYAIFSIN